MAASSSAMRIFPVAINLHLPAGGKPARTCRVLKSCLVFLDSASLSRASRPGQHIQGHVNPERRAAGKRLAFYGTSVIANNLGNQSKPQASSGRFRGDEGIVQIG